MAPQFIEHSDQVTEYDKANLALYLEIIDRDALGQSYSEIAAELWGSPLPDRAEDLVKDHMIRAKWFTENPLLLLNLHDGPPIDEKVLMQEFLDKGRITQEDYDNWFDPNFTGNIKFR